MKRYIASIVDRVLVVFNCPDCNRELRVSATRIENEEMEFCGKYTGARQVLNASCPCGTDIEVEVSEYRP